MSNTELFDEVPEAEKADDQAVDKWGVEPGKVYRVESARSDFAHRIMCGDSISRRDVQALGAESVDVICTDPPYSSGGWQEAEAASSESVGVRDSTADTLCRDRLGVEGYKELIAQSFARSAADSVYCFTDWRMWGHTKSAIEAAGHPVRQMLIWKKSYAGMGVDWRQMTELICYTRSGAGKPKGSRGNVLECARTGNEHHPTEKPVKLLRELVGFRDPSTCYDPFCGSGSTLLACEMERVQFFGMEVAPEFVAATLERCEKFGLNVCLNDDG